MAVIHLPAFSGGASGSVGGEITFSRRRSKTIASAPYIHKDARSPDQLAFRSKITQISQLFSGIPSFSIDKPGFILFADTFGDMPTWWTFYVDLLLPKMLPGVQLQPLFNYFSYVVGAYYNCVGYYDGSFPTGGKFFYSIDSLDQWNETDAYDYGGGAIFCQFELAPLVGHTLNIFYAIDTPLKFWRGGIVSYIL